MATGDQTDFVSRLTKLLPRGWFGETASTPFLQGVLAGIAYSLADAYSWITYARTCIRWSTATADALDAKIVDFLGGRIVRNAGETDAALRIRALRELLRPRATRAALVQEIVDTTGQQPLILEPWSVSDTGGLGARGDTTPRGLYFNSGVGRYGSRSLPYQVFATVYRPQITLVPGIVGYNCGGLAGYGTRSQPTTYYGPMAYLTRQSSTASDDQIYSAIAGVLPAGVTCWTRLTNTPPVAGTGLDYSFVLGSSKLG